VNRGRSVVWLAIAFFAIVAALSAIAGASYTVNALSVDSDYSGLGPPQALSVAVGCFFGSGLLVYCLIQLEHKLRRPGWDDDFAAPVGGRRWRRNGGRARAAPIILSFGLLTYLGVVIGFAVSAASTHAQGALSSYVQNGGVRRAGAILRVQNIEDEAAKGGPYYTALITVRLAPPMAGHSTTIVHEPQRSGLVAGQGIEILVDPHQPAYSELPGLPFVRSWQWVIASCIGLGFALVGVLPMVSMIVHMVGRYRRRGTLTGEHTQRALHGS
jgi:hypothetical protein